MFMERSERKNQLKTPYENERIILNWFFKKLDGEMWTGWSWHRIGTGGGLL